MDQPSPLRLSRARRLALAASLFGVAAALPGCTGVQEERAPYYDGAEAGPTGSLGLSLTLSNGALLDSIEVQISGAALVSPVTRSISVEPSSATASAEFGGLPQGSYAVALSAVSIDGDTTCSGSATFTIVPEQTVGVVVPLTCRAEGTGGEVIIDVGLNVCPTLQFLFVAPLKTPVGSIIAVEGSVIDPDGDPISYAWTAGAGTFANPSAAATNYTCTQPGLQTLTLSTNDGGDCVQNTHIQVACILTRFSSCEAGEYQTVAPTELNDRECAPCAAGSYSTIDNALSCVPHTTCEPGEFTDVLGTAVSDQTCDDCPAGTFSDVDNAPLCAPWSPCAWGEVQVAQGTRATDTQCGPGGEPFRQFGTSGIDSVQALATDAEGSVYAAGITQGALGGDSAGNHDAFLRKLDWTGEVVWTRQFGTSSVDYATGVAVASDGTVFMAGYTVGSLDQANLGLTDAFLRKYDSEGVLVWARQFGTTNHDYGYGVSVDTAGNVFIAGMTEGALDGANFGGPDGYVRKYSALGSVLWTRQYGSSAFEFPAGVSVDAAGNAFVAGATSGNVGGTNAGSQDGYVLKYSPTGNLLWTVQFGTSAMEAVRGPAVDANGQVHVVGGTTGALTGVNAGSQDAFLRSYDGDGALLFSRQFGTSGVDAAQGVAVRASGDVYVGGVTSGALDGPSSGGFDSFIRHYSSTGTLLWSDQYGTATNDTAIAAAVDGSIKVFAAGSTDGALVGTSFGNTDAYILRVPEP